MDTVATILVHLIISVIFWMACLQIATYFHYPAPTYFQTCSILGIWNYAIRGNILHVRILK